MIAFKIFFKYLCFNKNNQLLNRLEISKKKLKLKNLIKK